MGKNLIKSLLSDRKVVHQAHNRARGIVGFQEAGDLAQSALMEMWEKKPEIRDLDHFWTIYTTTAQRIRKTARQKERRSKTLSAGITTQSTAPATAHEYCETCQSWENLTEEQKQLAIMKAAGMNNKQIARMKKTRLANVTKSLRMIKAQISA